MQVGKVIKIVAGLAITSVVVGCNSDTEYVYVDPPIADSIDLGPFKCTDEELAEDAAKDCRLYIKGSMNSWSSRPEAQLHYQGEGEYIALFSMQPGEYSFKISDPSWSAERDLAIGEDADAEVVFDIPMELQRKYDDFGNQNMDITVSSDEDQVYRFTLDSSSGINNPSLLIENITDTDADKLSEAMYIVGTFNDWTASDNAEFTYKGAGNYEAEVTFAEAGTVSFNVHQGMDKPNVYGSLDNQPISLTEGASALTTYPGGKMSAHVEAGSYVFSLSILGDGQLAVPLSIAKVRAVIGHDTITAVNVATNITSDGSTFAQSYAWDAEGDMSVSLSDDTTQAQASVRQMATADTEGRYTVTLTTNKDLSSEASASHDVDVIELFNANNIVMMIGDGMGYPQLDVTRAYQGEALFLESGKHRGDIKTASADTLGYENLAELGMNYYTDSAAAATAMATGRKVVSGTIAQARPGDGSNLETILEYAQSLGKSVGIVATSHCVHATPAAFASHGPNRNDFVTLSKSMYGDVQPNVTLCGSKQVDGVDVISAEATAAGYTVVDSKTALIPAVAALPATDPNAEILFAGIFGEDEIPYVLPLGDQKSYEEQDIPQLNEMTQIAIEILSKNPNGFVLMVEGSQIDFAGHLNDEERVIHETIAFDKTVQEVASWAELRSDSMVIVTADHETGGLALEKTNGIGQVPEVSWKWGSHTNVDVPIASWGLNSHAFVGRTVENTAIYNVMRGALNAE
ncbi:MULTISPECIES: alkaline phosphatase [unclassified Agarivorans]|uniref:alkaline phosphatase n=1 Tax=unclassified Agarivorans TaxID=2636026 RepID=UPI0026E389E9|nr:MULTISPECIES: alkaline phosphatase [unclassified Agarivorans]MDO6685573.1 alkaline phosphatase [Agarivorans sp. 3_MG-2023]MDO6715959.1 alkaline phosphatase [Agarivorans sp. 2_MG-2023]